MRKLIALACASVVTFALSAPVFAASPDVYVVNFRHGQNQESQNLDRQLNSALRMIPGNIEHVVIDTTNAAKWEKSAHEAFNRDIVPVFNKWVGLPGFAAIVDARSKRVIGCVNSQFDSHTIAREIRRMSDMAAGHANISRTSWSKTTQCPPAKNKPPQ